MEQRREPRIPHNIRFFVHVSECDENPDLVGVSVECAAVDFSKRGLQFSTAEALPVGALLNITIGIGDPFAMYLLGGEIRWVRVAGEEHYMGVMLTDGERFHTEKWSDDFDGIFSAG